MFHCVCVCKHYANLGRNFWIRAIRLQVLASDFHTGALLLPSDRKNVYRVRLVYCFPGLPGLLYQTHWEILRYGRTLFTLTNDGWELAVMTWSDEDLGKGVSSSTGNEGLWRVESHIMDGLIMLFPMGCDFLHTCVIIQQPQSNWAIMTWGRDRVSIFVRDDSVFLLQKNSIDTESKRSLFLAVKAV